MTVQQTLTGMIAWAIAVQGVVMLVRAVCNIGAKPRGALARNESRVRDSQANTDGEVPLTVASEEPRRESPLRVRDGAVNARHRPIDARQPPGPR